MAQAARQALTIAPRYQKPANYNGTDTSWRVLCDLFPSAESVEIIQAVVEYCAVRRLDPFKKPVHIVPIYNSKLRRRVQVVMQGINELEITAHRTKLFAGADEADYGPDETKTFKGTTEDDRGETKAVEVTLTYPVSAAVTVYRIVQGEKRAFRERVWFAECYGRAGFRSEVPNARWTLAPRQMLAKCAKAASLRLAFPEELGGEYALEEMEDREIETGGVTIEGRVDHGDPGLSDRDRQADAAYPPREPSGGATAGLALLDEPNGSRWIKNLETLLKAAATDAEIDAIEDHPRVKVARDKAASLVRSNITDWVNEARKRAHTVGVKTEAEIEEPPPHPGDDAPEHHPDIPRDDDWPDDPIRELLAEIEEMDADALDSLATNAAWKVKTRDMFPPDEDRLRDAIATRRAILKGGKTT